jgi:hypothetical protein
MTPVMTGEFEAVLAGGALQEAPAELGIGRELSFVDGPAREVVVHFGADESLQYLRDVTNRILALEAEWLLAPRRGAVASLGLLPEETSARAIRFEAAEHGALSHFLCTRPMELGCTSVDLYVVSGQARFSSRGTTIRRERGLASGCRGVLTQAGCSRL